MRLLTAGDYATRLKAARKCYSWSRLQLDLVLLDEGNKVMLKLVRIVAGFGAVG